MFEAFVFHLIGGFTESKLNQNLVPGKNDATYNIGAPFLLFESLTALYS